MILSDYKIRRLGLVQPCEERGTFRGMSYGLSSCGYDCRVDLSLPVGEKQRFRVEHGAAIRILPQESLLLPLREHFSLVPWIAGFVKDKSTWARQGLVVSSAVLEPGWRGYFCLRATNVSDNMLTIVDGDPICQVVFERLDGIPERSYSGKYQGQPRGVQEAKFE